MSDFERIELGLYQGKKIRIRPAVIESDGRRVKEVRLSFADMKVFADAGYKLSRGHIIAKLFDKYGAFRLPRTSDYRVTRIDWNRHTFRLEEI